MGKGTDIMSEPEAGSVSGGALTERGEGGSMTGAHDEAGAESGAQGSFRLENARRRARYMVVFIGLFLALVLISVINVNTGSVDVSIRELWRILIGLGNDSPAHDVVWGIRVPRIFMAMILGGALSVSGFLLQTFFDNPIAGPFILGISHGAKLMVAIVMILMIGTVGSVSSYALILAAFAGALMSTGFILLVSRRIDNMAVLLVAGIMIGYICTAATDFIITFASDADIVNLYNWSQGSFNGMRWADVKVAAIVIGITMTLTFLLSKPIGAYQLGEHYAQSMGVNIRFFRVALIVLSSVLSATVTAFAGPISFVGIAVPFLVKNALGTTKPIVVIPATFLGGSAFCLMCDLIARLAFAPTELYISTVTAVFGAPVVIFMMLNRNTRKKV